MTIMPLGIKLASEEYTGCGAGVPNKNYFRILAATYNGDSLDAKDQYIPRDITFAQRLEIATWTAMWGTISLKLGIDFGDTCMMLTILYT